MADISLGVCRRPHLCRRVPGDALVQAMFTLYRLVKRSVAESVPDRASVHTRNAAFEAVSAPEQYCSAPLLKVERSVSDRFLRRSESSLNTFIGAEIATEPRIGKLSFQIKRERCKLHKGYFSLNDFLDSGARDAL